MPNQLAILAPAGQLVRGETIVVPIVLTLEKRIKSRGIHARFWGAEETHIVRDFGGEATLAARAWTPRIGA